MISDLNERLARAAEERARLEKLRRQVAEMEAEHREAATAAARLEQTLAKEERDVARLEGLSLSGLVASFFGSKDEKLRRERQEAVAAQLRYDEARVRTERLAAELAQARREIDRLSGAEANYKTLLAEKERLIRESQAAGPLLALSEQEQQAAWQLKELEEARRAGIEADAALARVESSLQSARNWGTWDMLGGGIIATAGKHARIDEAKGELYHAQQAMARFRRELKDVQMGLHVPVVEMDGFTRFADYFFDGLFMDIAVQSRINESLRSVDSSRRRVSGALHWVDQQLSAARAEVERVRQQKQRFVEGYQGQT
ncbi:MAG: hypothetical protein ACOY94_28605 [Bacillota bacterium]